MYIESVPNRDSPPAILLRESYREGGKVKKRTLLRHILRCAHPSRRHLTPDSLGPLGMLLT
jgi:hypothetical protein